MASILDRFRRTHSPGSSVTAAAKIIEPSDEEEAARIRRGAKDWQKDSWRYFDDLAEISYAMTYQSSALARLRMAPAMRPDPREPPVFVDPDGDDDLDLTDEERTALNATIDRLGSSEHPLSEIQRLGALNIAVAGEGYLLGYNDPDRGGEFWDVVSVEELVKNPNGPGFARRLVEESGPQNVETLPEETFICRLYQRHPRFSSWSWSQMRGVLPLCEELKVLTDAIRAGATSRIPAGILALSHGFRSQGPIDETMTGQADEAANDPVVRDLIEHFETPITNRRSASAVVPFLLFGEIDDIEKGLKPIEFKREIDKLYAEQRAEVIARIATGIDLPAEVLQGKVDLNHWTAWQVSEEAFKYHLEPDAQVLWAALTIGYFRPHLAAMNIPDLQRFFLWYDPSDLINHPDREKSANDGYDRIVLSGDAWRRAHNYADDDAPDRAEVAERAWQEILKRLRLAPGQPIPTPEQLLTGLLPVDQAQGAPVEPGEKSPPQEGDNPPPEAAPPGANPNADPNNPGGTQPGPARTQKPGATQPNAPKRAAAANLPSMASLVGAAGIAPLGIRLVQLESTLRGRLQHEADAVMRRALERAGNRLRNLANKRNDTREIAKGVPTLELAKVLGPEKVAQLATSAEDLLVGDGSIDALGSKFETWTARAQEQALAAIADNGDITEGDLDLIAQDQANHRAEGWAVLSAGLLALAAGLIYKPGEPPPDKGEYDGFEVPAGLIRTALIEAGGGADGDTTAGLLSGTDIHSAFDQADLEVTGYVWVTGAPQRPFEPHQDLGGTEISGRADDQLSADPGDFPFVYSYWPDDHPGCQCDVIEQTANREPPAETLG
jgi:hypothetical protein